MVFYYLFHNKIKIDLLFDLFKYIIVTIFIFTTKIIIFLSWLRNNMNQKTNGEL
ncbi:hypothetical protein DDB_G0287567 [Dictyostelium discoideum AX4]|uniref:hypothetical protein n=1 Tax=Dictyostelium discoideum AX4 TaxID=352472 RepID=UPI00004E2E0C|nr:hypothetical protein DDB_G0287567 [Dictyostelium discoideum AX4]EAL63683.1 hypothetical protein DDB_G0287567 [Dictyostelium discoideum AX4]|eukprot:XP_637172.1 hypothetical protein DDB_G0287567 [Dictyostelium discoideum AX4]